MSTGLCIIHSAKKRRGWIREVTMRPTSIAKIAEVIGAKVLGSGDLAAQITGVSTDSRTLAAGQCFVAIAGKNFDGHEYIVPVLAAGAACAISARPIELGCGIVLQVADPIAAMGDLARWYRLSLPAKVVAITGSAGKTSTREIVAHVLASRMAVHCAQKSFNNNIGLPLTLLGAEDRHQSIITELGTNAPGEISYLAKIALPDIALITNIHPAHLEGFGSVDGIVQEKSSIVEGLRPGGMFWINGDFANLRSYCDRKGYSYRTFGFSEDCEIRGINSQADESGGAVTIEGVRVRVPLVGRANLANCIAAWAICRQLGLTIRQFADAVAGIKPVAMRLQVDTVGPIRMINDCYNANPASMANALDYLRTFGKGRRVFVCGSMAELGPDSPAFHRQLGKLAAEAGVEVLLASGSFAAEVVDAAGSIATAQAFATTQELVDSLRRFIQPDDIVLVKGSRSAKLETAVEQLRKWFGISNCQ